MKKTFTFFIHFLFVFVGFMAVVCSCDNDPVDEQNGPESKDWHCAKAQINVDCLSFDITSSASRAASDYSWNDGDVIYLLLTDKYGGNVQAYIKYDGNTKTWSDVMYEGNRYTLICDTEHKLVAYYIEGVNDLSGTSVSIKNDQAIYICYTGSYTYPADGDMSINVLLRPWTGRIRFQGSAGTTATISGVLTYSEFSPSTGKFSISTSPVNTMVTSTGFTPYMYCLFEDSTNPMLLVTTDNMYKAEFDPSSSILKVGKSGFLDLPVSENFNGWELIVPVAGVTLDNTSISLKTGESAILKAAITPENATDCSVCWESSEPTVVSVNNNGKVTGLKEGVATITVTSVQDDSQKATCVVTVSGDYQVFTVRGVTFRMNLVEGGTFQMGAISGENEQPVHTVTISNDYYIGETEVTQALWKAVTGDSPTSTGSSWQEKNGLGDNYPAYFINYYDVQSFIAKLNVLTGKQFRMPTEAEWEFAARGGNKSRGYDYSGSNVIDDVGWYEENSSPVILTHEVKAKAPNELGLYDMSGNVSEWCSDWYGHYNSGSVTDPSGPEDGTYRALRGGSINYHCLSCRSTDRGGGIPGEGSWDRGFRLAMSYSSDASNFENGHEYVDLGLPSGTLWATCNVGASSREEYGYYFAWGETTSKDSYDESNYSYSDNPNTLSLDRDAAHFNWGGNWRMPTNIEFQELYDECTWNYTTIKGKFDIVYSGVEVISKANGNSIFLPAAGEYTSVLINQGQYGFYWSSSLYDSEESAFMLCFEHGYSRLSSNHNVRFVGQSIRPVLHK